ncbi:MAG: sulfotransferase [Bacteroidia bacterium]|nr:sulfotransferase [Bacteroidia bacterium]
MSTIIHVGMPKTATTFLQKEVFPKVEGAFYYGRDHDLWDLIFHLPFKHRRFEDVGALQARIAAARERIGEKTLLISHESLSGHPWHNFMNHEEGAAMLKELFPEAKILITLRRQDDFLESLYLHSLQVGFAQKVNRFLNFEQGKFGSYRYNGGLNIDVHKLDYAWMVDVYAELFDRENVLVLPYEEIKKDSKGFLDKIFAFAGLTPFYPPKPKKKVNRGLSKSTSRLALWFNPCFRNSQSNGFGFIPQQPFSAWLGKMRPKGRVWVYLFRISRKMTFLNVLRLLDRVIGVKGNWIKADQRRQIMELHAASNRRLEEDFGVNLKDYGYF